jgi:hypothetical protein
MKDIKIEIENATYGVLSDEICDVTNWATRQAVWVPWQSINDATSDPTRAAISVFVN